MKKFSFVLSTAVMTLFLTVSITGADLLKKGKGVYRSARSSNVDYLKMGDERMQINFNETGVVVEAPKNSPFQNASFNTMGTIHVINGKYKYNGAALWTCPNGDRIFGTFKGEGGFAEGTTQGKLEITGGTGECTGITGVLHFKSGPKIKSSKKGTSQGITVGTIKWNIP